MNTKRGKNYKYKKNEPAKKDESICSGGNKNIIEKVKTIAEPLCLAEGMELVFVEYRPEAGGTVLRLYIDKPGGVTLDDCAGIGRELSDLLDVYIETKSSYRLEVSSPGTDRPLVTENDFERFKGKMATIKTETPIDGQKNFKGILQGISDGNINLMVNNKTIAIPHSGIKKARLANLNGDIKCL